MSEDHSAIATEQIQQYVLALGLTLAIEMPIYVFGLTRMQAPFWSAAGLGVFVNLVTHPNVWFVLPRLVELRLGYTAFLLIAEAFAWLVEWVVLWLFLRRRPLYLLALSLFANGSSALFGGWLFTTISRRLV